MATPLVSVIIAAYRAENTLNAALDSVARQSRGDWECIVVDDASDDNTLTIALMWTRRDSRFRVLSTNVNSGPSAARNLGLDAARGDWLTILDADDMYEPERLDILLNTARSLRVDIIVDNQWLFDSRAQLRRRWLAMDDSKSRSFGLLRFLYQISGLSSQHWGIAQPLFRRRLIEQPAIRYESGLKFGEDVLFMAQLITRAGRFGISGRVGYVYRLPVEAGTNLSLSNNDDALSSTRRMISVVGPVAGLTGRGLLRLRLVHFSLTGWRADLRRSLANKRYARVAILVASTPRAWLWLLLTLIRKIKP